MCGIFFQRCREGLDANKLLLRFNKLNYRGPDHSEIYQLDNNTVMGFHRLSVNDLSTVGHQPFELDNLVMVCNGEIYNHEQLLEEYHFSMRSWSDCEVILHLYKRFGKDIKQTLNKLNGVFAFVIYDTATGDIVAARDPIGVRPLFYHHTKDNICLLSEAKGTELHCRQFRPGTFVKIKTNTRGAPVTEIGAYTPFGTGGPKRTITPEILMETLETAVYNRVKNSDREIGCFLSGGVDSLITTVLTVAALKKLGRDPKDLKVFTIGFKDCDSADVKAAREISRILGTDHHCYEPPIQKGFQAISRTIYHLESWDTTTVRASVPQYLLSKYIAEHTNVRVLISGEGSDELLGGYLYFNNCPDTRSFIQERKRLVSELCYFDVLRTDRTTAGNGLEVRVPFLDSVFVNTVNQIDPNLLLQNSENDKKEKMTKLFLRNAFEHWISERQSDPDLAVALKPFIYRAKDAFSDAVGHSWADSIGSYAEDKLTEESIPSADDETTPRTYEAMYYQQVFKEFYGTSKIAMIPKYWMPRWQPAGLKDPSARSLVFQK